MSEVVSEQCNADISLDTINGEVTMFTMTEPKKKSKKAANGDGVTQAKKKKIAFSVSFDPRVYQALMDFIDTFEFKPERSTTIERFVELALQEKGYLKDKDST